MYDKFILKGRLRFFRFICLVEREKLILLPYAGKTRRRCNSALRPVRLRVHGVSVDKM